MAWLTAAWTVLAVVTGAFFTGALMGTLGPIQNPLGVEGLTRVYVALFVKLRDETDLGTLSGELIGAVKETMQPEHASLWLRPDTTSGGLQTR